ncbi:MAG TPA: BACON domain-containing carbohydrate-binding protein [Blastocatellia bacterium]|nr:BACON domain-containing carbohydrate-binding protein [Blastocatellia bacterium]
MRSTHLRLIFVAVIYISGSSILNAGATQNSTPPGIAAPATTIQLDPVVSGLSAPLYVTNARDGSNRLFIIEQGGRIKVLQPGATTPTVFLDITAKVLSGGERGLLGLAFHPQYATSRRFFVNYTRQTDGATVIAEYLVSVSNPNVADIAETTLLTIPQPFANHNGGMIEFGPDGFLYIAMGDGGSGNDPGNRAQNIEDLLGKFLRIDIDIPNGSSPYSSPPTNPFFGPTVPGRDEIYAVGMRNPWRFSFDRLTGELYVGDVGQGAREEIDIVTLGGNYGWRVFEGFLCTNLDPALCSASGFTPPIADYAHALGRCSISGGYVYRGALGSLPTGAYVYSDFCTGEIFMLSGGVQTLLLDTALNVASFGEDEAGEIYVVHLGGTVSRIATPPPVCTFSILPTSESFPATGGTGSVAVTAPNGCAWTAVSNAGWITITSGSIGSGDGMVAYSVAANPAQNARVGTITIAGQTFTVSQAGIVCNFSISPMSQSFGSSGGTGIVTVNAASACNWTAASNASWITITSGANGDGNGSVGYRVDANTRSTPRAGSLTIAGQTFMVAQAGMSCVTSVAPTSMSFGPTGGSGAISVLAPIGCNWPVSSDSSWITISSGATGTASNKVKYAVAPNAGTSPRAGTITIGDRPVAISQAGGTACSFSLGSTSQSFGSSAGAGSVGVMAPAGCIWTALSNAEWVTVTSGSAGSGAGNVNYSVATNPGTTSRMGTMTIAGLTFTVTQSGASGGCTFTLSPMSRSFDATGGPGSVNVTTTTACVWTAVSNASWITINSGGSGSGSGVVNYTVAVNPLTTPRNGTMTIAGLSFSVTQSGAAGGCSYSVSAPRKLFTASGGTGGIAVTAPTGCGWTAVSNVGWITVSSGASGSGNGTVAFAVAANTTGRSRSGTILVAGILLTIKQS